MADWIFQYLFTITEAFLIYKFIDSYIERRVIRKKIAFVVGGIFLIVIVSIYNAMFPLSILKFILSVGMIFYIELLFVGDFGIKVLLAAYYGVFSMALEIIVVLAISVCTSNELIQSEDNNKLFCYISLILYYLIKLMVIIIMHHFKTRRSYHRNLSGNILLALTPMSSIVLLYVIFSKMIREQKDDYAKFYFLIFTTILINSFIYALFEYVNKLDQEKLEKYLSLEIAKNKDEYYRKIERNQQEIRMIRHNLKNELIIYKSHLTEKRYKDLEIMIDNHIKNITMTENTDFTKNRAINTILNVKLNEAKQDNINCKFDVWVPEDIKINSMDIGILLGNTLDNAIEACRKVKIEERYISLSLIFYNQILILSVKNSTNGFVSNLMTSKSDKNNHGIGLKSVESIAKKYNSNIDFFIEDQSFKIETSLWVT
mgnify:CR=1 FL=1|jgi:hypothetical protein